MTAAAQDPRSEGSGVVAGDCAAELLRRNASGRDAGVEPPSAPVRTVLREVGRRIEPPLAAEPSLVGMRSEFDLYRDIAAVLRQFDASDCSSCRAINTLIAVSQTRRCGEAPTAILSPCGWVALVEDADAWVVSAVSLDLSVLLDDRPDPGGSKV